VTSHNEFSEKYSFLDEYVSKKLVYVLISHLVINPLYLFVKIFYQGKILRFQNVMRCDVTPVIFAYETKLNILASYQNSIKEIIN
jgi:hypothetical protein